MVSAELRQRAISGIVLALIALAAVWQGGIVTALLLAALGVIGFSEWVRMAQSAAVSTRLLERAGAAAIVLALGLLYGVEARAALLALLAGFAAMLAALMQQGGRRPLLTAAGVIYLGAGLLALLWLRLQPDSGFTLMIYLLLVVWGTDSGAYFAGRAIGGPKLMPKISPSKTWAGLGGGVVTAALLAYGVAWVQHMRAPGLAVGLAALLAVVAQAGDLFESYVKRRCGVKDSGSLIPGHGGVLDRIDGLIFAAVFLVLCLLAGEQYQWW